MHQFEEFIRRSIEGKKAVLLFTGDKGSVLLMKIINNMDVRVVFIDTGYQFNEIIDFVRKYSNKIETAQESTASADAEADMAACCGQRKADVLKKYLQDINAQCLIVPFMNEERDSGIEDSYLNGIDNVQIIRPLADFPEREVWMKIKEHKLSFPRTYNRGYRLVDCKCCITRHGRRRENEVPDTDGLDRETEEKLKALGYM